MSDKTKRRQRLYEADPYCSFCGCKVTIEVVKPHTSQPPNFGVLFSHVNELGMPATKLACLKCATLENDKKQAALGIEELRLRSSPQGKCLCPNCGTTHIRSIKTNP